MLVNSLLVRVNLPTALPSLSAFFLSGMIPSNTTTTRSSSATGNEPLPAETLARGTAALVPTQEAKVMVARKSAVGSEPACPRL